VLHLSNLLSSIASISILVLIWSALVKGYVNPK
jgi:hypothetical protein